MEFKDGLVIGFKPKFRSFGDDWERYMFAIVDLEEEGKITRTPGVPLYASHCKDGYPWLIDQYFDAGKFDLIEQHFTPSGETFYGPIGDAAQAVFDRFREMGQGARAFRILRAHTGLMKGVYWFYISERRKRFKYEPMILNVSEAEQRTSHDRFLAQIPEKKSILLKQMAEFRAVAVAEGCSASELDRIDADIAAIEAEERPKPQGKTDPRKMTEDVFWELIDAGLGVETLGERLDLLPERLALFKPSAIRGFDKLLREIDARAYRTDVWALAYLLQGGCSDDAFDAFRGWLILQGRAVFEATLADPDGFDTRLHHGSAGGMDALRDAAPIAYDLREGKAMPPVKSKLLKLTGAKAEEHDFAQLLPRVAAAVETV